MNWTKRGLKGLIVLAGLTLFLVACDRQEKDKPKGPSSQIVKTLIVQSKAPVQRHNFPGKVLAGRKVILAFQVPGQLITFPVEEGHFVEKDQVIARLDPRDYQTSYDAEKAKRVKAKRDLERAAELLKSGTIPAAEYDKRKAVYDVSVAKTDAALKALEDTHLKIPFSGLLAETFVDNYQNVEAKQKIASLQNIADVEISVDIPEQDIIIGERLRHHSKLQGKKIGYVTFEALPNRKFDVTIKKYRTEADPVTQTYRVTLSMPTPDDANILPGMTANFVLVRKEDLVKKIFLLPVSAIAIDDKGKHYVWVVDEKLTVHRRDISVGDFSGDQLEVTLGVKEGERIVAAGSSYMAEGMKVRLFKGKKEYK